MARASFSWKRGCLFDRLACLILYEMCLEDPVARVVNINARYVFASSLANRENFFSPTHLLLLGSDTSRSKPVPLATVELQKRASRFLHMASERTMAVAEELYQRGIISYPRTETQVFSDGFDLMGMVQEHANHAQWGGFATRLLNGEFEKPRAGQHDDKAHPPIHPTKCVDMESLNEEQRKVYELVVRHFLACCSKDAKGFQTTVTIDVAGEEFTTTGLMILERNWYDVYRYEHWSGTNIPCFQEGQTFMPKAIDMTVWQSRTISRCSADCSRAHLFVGDAGGENARATAAVGSGLDRGDGQERYRHGRNDRRAYPEDPSASVRRERRERAVQANTARIGVSGSVQQHGLPAQQALHPVSRAFPLGRS